MKVKKKRRMLSANEEQKFRTRKKKRGGSDERQTDISNAETPVDIVKADGVVRAHVSAGEIKGVIQETVWRVKNEISPYLNGNDDARLQSDEMSYILTLAMIAGWPEQQPRRGLKIRNYEYEEPRLCHRHQ